MPTFVGFVKIPLFSVFTLNPSKINLFGSGVLYNGCVDGSVVMRWARIKKPETLQVYLHLSPKYNNDTINLLPY